MAKKQHNERNPTRTLTVSDSLGAGCEETEINRVHHKEDQRAATLTGLTSRTTDLVRDNRGAGIG